MKRILLLLAGGAFAAGIVATLSQPFTRVDHLARAVAPPQVVTVNTSAQNVFTNNPSRTDGRIILRTIQNTGTNAVLYAIGTTVTDNAYHGIIAGGAALKDGLGALLDFSRFPGVISVKTESGSTTIAIVEFQQ